MSSTLRCLAEALGGALLPLVEASDDADLAIDFLRLLGWDVTAAPASFLALHDPLALAFDHAAGGDDGIDVDLAVLIPAVLAAWSAIDALSTAADLTAAQRSELPAQIVDALLVDQLRSHFPGWSALLDALGVVREEAVAEAPGRLPYLRTVLDRAKLLEYVDAPVDTLKATYHWGEAAFDSARVIRAASALARALGVRVDSCRPQAAIVSALGTRPAGPRAVLVERRGIPLVVGIAILQVPATPGAGPGFAVVPTTSAPTGTEVPLFGGRLLFDGDLAAGVGVAVRAGEPLQAVAGAGFRVGYEGIFDDPVTLLGDDDGARVEVGGLAASIEVSGIGADLELTAAIAAQDLALVLDGAAADGFVSAVLPSAGARVAFPLAVSWSSRTGLFVSGSAELATTVPVSARFGPIEVTEVSVALSDTSPAGGSPSLALEVGTTLHGALGPVGFAVEGVGVDLGLVLAAGNLGPLDVEVGFKPPTGVRLAIAAGPVRGGGHLGNAEGRYLGALALDVFGNSLSAVGLLDATGAGYSLVATVGSEFAPVPLPLGFTLEGVGGLIAVHRRVDTDALRAALRSSAGMGDLFFPADPLAQADRVTTDLARYFPAAAGRYVFGPAAKFGWGTPTIVRGEVAVLLELPAPARVVVLGTVSTRLPTEEQAILELNVDVLGEVDFAQKRVAIDATLRDSQVAGFPITGDLALRMGWGDPPSFVLSVGGFHSQFRPPPGFPELRRVHIPIGSGENPRLDMTGFLALTSNTAQIGAAVDLYAAAGPLNVVGNLGFEALIQFVPFGFEVDLWAGVALRRGTRVLAGVHLDGKLRGPTPWRFSGEACLSLWFIDLCVGFDATFGQERAVALPTRQIWPELKAALEDVRSWGTAMPAAAARAVTTATPRDDVTAVRIDPAATLSVQQKVVPLNREIERFAQVAPQGTSRFDVTGARLGDSALSPTPVEDWFAPAQFEDMTDDERLARPGYEKMVAGVSLASSAVVTAGPTLIKPLAYETIKFPDPEPLPEPYRPGRDLQLDGIATAASAQAPLRPLRAATALVTLAEETFVIASTLDLTPRLDIAPAAARTGAELALKAYLASHPESRGMLQVVPRYEVQELMP